jgi:hypothetical protein
VHPEILGENGQARAGELDDVSSRPKAATCRRTPKGFGLKIANNFGMRPGWHTSGTGTGDQRGDYVLGEGEAPVFI